MNTIDFTPAKLEKFKEAFFRAREDEEESFSFEGNEFVTDYAKWLIQYLEQQFNVAVTP